MSVFELTSPRRVWSDRAARLSLGLGTILALIPLALILGYLISKGIGALSWSFFTTDPTGRFFGDPGGVRSAILGTLEIVGLATLIAVPCGIGVALYLIEYGLKGKFAMGVRYFVDVMNGVPSIVFGLFIYITFILDVGFGGFAGWKGSVALALLMLPVVTRSAEVALGLVPDSLREASYALGARRSHTIFKVVLPTALPGLITGSLLAVARGIGETAPLLFTAFGAQVLTFNLSQPMNALPLQIFSDVRQAQDQLVQRAWGSALTLVLLIFILVVISRLIVRRSRVS